jgi:hypothetical protein
MKKKILALVLSVLMVTVSVSAGWDLEIGTGSLWTIGLKLSDVEAVSGEKGVEVYVYIEGNDGVCAGAFELEYDDTALALAKEPELVDLAGFEVTGAADLASSPYYTSIASDKAVVGDGKLLKYTFNVDSKAAEGVYEIKLVPAGEGGSQDIPLEFIDENREQVAAMLAAYNEAIELINANPDKYRAFALECANVPEALADSYPTPSFTANAVPTQEQIARVNTWLVEKELLSEPYTYEQMVDDSFVQD